MSVQLMKALLNPMRIRMLDFVAEGPISSDELAATLGERPNIVSYHARVLRAAGCLRHVRTGLALREEQRPYELTDAAVSARRLAEPQLAPSGSGHPSVSALRTIVETQETSIEPAPPEASGRENLRYASVALDRQGMVAISAKLSETLEEISQAQQESAQRLAGGGEAIEATIAFASFAADPQGRPSP